MLGASGQAPTYFDSRAEVDFAANIRAGAGILGREGLVKVPGNGWAELGGAG